MKIKKIERRKDTKNIYDVTLEPNWLERLFGIVERIESFKESGYIYIFGGDVYVDQTGKELDIHNKIGQAIDQFRRSW